MILEVLKNSEKNLLMLGLHSLDQDGAGYLLKEGKLVVTKTPNAENPIIHNMKPILACDVWEHSYYLDYKNKRPIYLENFFDKLINWEFVESNL